MFTSLQRKNWISSFQATFGSHRNDRPPERRFFYYHFSKPIKQIDERTKTHTLWNCFMCIYSVRFGSKSFHFYLETPWKYIFYWAIQFRRMHSLIDTQFNNFIGLFQTLCKQKCISSMLNKQILCQFFSPKLRLIDSVWKLTRLKIPIRWTTEIVFPIAEKSNEISSFSKWKKVNKNIGDSLVFISSIFNVRFDTFVFKTHIVWHHHSIAADIAFLHEPSTAQASRELQFSTSDKNIQQKWWKK